MGGGDAQKTADILACDDRCDGWNDDDNSPWCHHATPTTAFHCGGSQGTGGDESAGVAPAWDPGLVVDYDSSSHLYVVDAAFVADLKAWPSLLANDRTVLTEVSGGFQFKNVDRGTLADELGFQENDIPLKVGGVSVSTFQGVLEAADAIYDSTAITVEVSRGGATVTLDYVIQ